MTTRYVIACAEGYFDTYDGFTRELQEARKYMARSVDASLNALKAEYPKFKFRKLTVESDTPYGEYRVVGRGMKFRQIDEGDEILSHFDDGTKFDPEYLFRRLNDKCKGCVHTCKQSVKAEILRCPQYESVNAAEKKKGAK